jgi:predicted 3-demethylubiquinone-9 3-methyltransferase (glyoxalase superfamily)
VSHGILPGYGTATKEKDSMQPTKRITPCLWFDDQAEEAAKFYTGIFPRSEITQVSRYGEAGREVHGKAPGTVMTIAFELDGTPFTALNGGPEFRFTEAISFQVLCETQDEVDHYWNRLSAGGDPQAQQCGWIKDRFGVSWQIIPRVMLEMMADPDHEKSQRVTAAMMQMKKLDIAALKSAYAG